MCVLVGVCVWHRAVHDHIVQILHGTGMLTYIGVIERGQCRYILGLSYCHLLPLKVIHCCWYSWDRTNVYVFHIHAVTCNMMVNGGK